MKNISIIDHALKKRGGHHLDLCLIVIKLLHKYGYNVSLYSHVDIDEETAAAVLPYAKIIPYFNLNPYDNIVSRGKLSYLNTVTELIMGRYRTLPEADLFIFPSIFIEHVNALNALSANQKVAGAIHLPPNWPNESAKKLWEIVLNSSNRNSNNTLLGVFESELLLEYEILLNRRGICLERFPIYKIFRQIDCPRDELLTVAILGHHRAGKSEFLGPVIDSLIDAKFKVILNDSSGTIQPGPGVYHNGQLHVYGYVERLSDLIHQADAVILPYDKYFYRHNGSGIAWESTGAGVPIVGPAGTSISRIIHQYGNGTLFYDNNAAEVMRGVMDLKTNYKNISNNAYKASGLWNSVNGSEKFVHRLLEMLA